MSFGYITPATRADGEKVILKCVPPAHFRRVTRRPGAFLANCPEESCAGQDLDEIAIRRINIMIKELRMPPNRVIKWGVILSCIWSR